MSISYSEFVQVPSIKLIVERNPLKPQVYHLEQETMITGLFFCTFCSKLEGQGEKKIHPQNQNTRVTGFFCGSVRDAGGAGGRGDQS